MKKIILRFWDFKPIVFALFIFSFNFSYSQNRNYAQFLIDTLSSKTFSGRGYVNNGDQKAAQFIATQFNKLGLKAFENSDYMHNFTFPVVVFSKKCKVTIDGKTLLEGKDYLINPSSPSINKKLKIKPINKDSRLPSKHCVALLYDTSYKFSKNELKMTNDYKLRISLQKKLTWSVSTSFDKNSNISILKSSMPDNARKIKINIKSKIKKHNASNVIGYIEGKEIKDTFIVITAHFDHLGMLGKAIFPGANDNASGTAMMIDLANYFTKNPCKYSIAFMAFAGEEPGLIGSKHYTDNPYDNLPLNKIKFLVNLDLMGSGENGMAVVNATVFQDYFNKLQNINNEKKYLPEFKVRGKAANSDHYWFTERGVKCFFFYLMGSYNHYHDIHDNSENLKLGNFYDKAFLLIRDFILSV